MRDKPFSHRGWSISSEKIAIASDHAGLGLKRFVIDLLQNRGYGYDDLGTDSEASVDYPDYGHIVAERITSGQNRRAILICGTGIGMSITANRHQGVRAALCNDIYSARMSRLHNDSNVLVVGGRVIGPALAEEIVLTWLNTDFEGGRHTRRLEKIDKAHVESVVKKVVANYLDKLHEVDSKAIEKMIHESVNQILNGKQEENNK